MLLKKLFVYTCFLIKEFPLLKELIVIIMTLMKQIPRPKILCKDNNSAILFKDKLYIWGDYLRLPGGNMSANLYWCGITQGRFDSSRGEGPLLSNIVKLSTGNSHYVAIDKNGIVYSWGTSFDGQLGIKSSEYVSRPQKIPISDIVISASCGMGFTILLTQDNKIFGCGSNTSGQLGLGKYAYKVYEPTKINVDNVISVSCGTWHTMVLTLTNQIYVFGSNKYGQLGIESKMKCNYPTLLDYPFDSDTTDTENY